MYSWLSDWTYAREVMLWRLWRATRNGSQTFILVLQLNGANLRKTPRGGPGGILFSPACLLSWFIEENLRAGTATPTDDEFFNQQKAEEMVKATWKDRKNRRFCIFSLSVWVFFCCHVEAKSVRYIPALYCPCP